MHAPDATVVAVAHHFDAEVVDVRPRGGVGVYPDRLGRCRRTTTPIVGCATCTTPTVARYAGSPSCHRCAWTRWRLAQLTAWRRVLDEASPP
jgi:hypothetical protein